MSFLDDLRRAADPSGYQELERVTGIPFAEALVSADEVSKRWVKPEDYAEGFRLTRAQAKGIHAWETYGALIGSLKVGAGKTGLCHMIASHYFARTEGQGKILWIFPANLGHALRRSHLPFNRRYLRVDNLRVINLHGLTAPKRRKWAKSGYPGCYLLPISLLSVKDTQELLEGINADLVIIDEAHMICGDVNTAAKLKRFYAWTSARKQRIPDPWGTDRPSPRGAAVSGTITRRTPMEYHRLVRWILGDRSPLPLSPERAKTWSALIRANAHVPSRRQLQLMRPLTEWAGKNWPQDEEEFGLDISGIRAAYKRRLFTTPGVVSSGAGELGVSLTLEAWTHDPPGAKLLGHMHDLHNDAIHPNGDALEHGIEIYQTMGELLCGFYYDRYWPAPAPTKEGPALLEQAKERHERSQEYRREMWAWFGSQRTPKEAMDTPLLLALHMSHHGSKGVPQRLYDLWVSMHALDHDDLPERLSRPVRVDDFKIRSAVRWAKRHKHGIIWVLNVEIMDWLCQALREEGVEPLAKPATEAWEERDGSGSRICVASHAHGLGKNLQHEHRHQLFLQLHSNMEQCLGRLHRPGQKADSLTAHLYYTLPQDQMRLSSMILREAYRLETTEVDPPKLLSCTWNPPPPIYDRDMLVRHGFSAPALGSRSLRRLRELFG